MRDGELPGFTEVTPLGSGGLGDVFRATRISTGGTVAIKVLRDLSDPEVAAQRAQRELSALVGLRGHPNVVNVEEVVDTGAGGLAIVMEHAPGGSVVDLVRARGGTLPFPETLLVATETAAALAAAHERGIIHRDIKPGNLLVGAFGNVKVCDFGIAALTQSHDVADRTSSLSLRFASPEELRGATTIGPATDVYSLAATIHFLLTGSHLPAPDGTAGSIPLRRWVAPDDLPSDVEVEFRELVRRSADRVPGNRPTAAELHDGFEQLAGRLGAARCRALPVATDGLEDATHVAPIAQVDATVAAPSAAATAGTATAVSFEHTAALPTSEPVAEPPRRRWGKPIAFGAVVALVVAVVALALANRDDGDNATPADPTAPTIDPGADPAPTTSPTATSTPAPAPTTPADTAATTVPATTTAPSTTSTTPPPEPLDLTSATEVRRFAISSADRFGGRSFESIDGLAVDPRTGQMVAAKEVAAADVAAADPSRGLPALFSFSLDDPSLITPLGTLTDASGAPFGPELDIEGLAALDDGTFMIVSEGSGELANQGGAFLLRVDSAGAYVSSFEFPNWFIPSVDGTVGFADRLGPHGVAVRPGSPTEVVVIIEAALRQDDPSLIRLTSFDVNTTRATREWSYPIDPDFVTISMTTVDDRGIVVLEQNRTTRRRELFLVELDDGDEPGGPQPPPLDKQAIATDEAFGGTPWASIADVPSTGNGEFTVVLMTDNFFRDDVSTGTTVTVR